MWPWLPNLEGPVPTYYLITSLAFVLSLLWIVRRAQKAKMNSTAMIDLLMVMMISAFVGARLFQVFYEEPQFYRDHPLSIFKFWYGGFVFYGGFVGALAAALIFKKFKNYDFWKTADILTPPLALGYGIGRWACFFAGCCYGRQTSLPWGITFPPWSESPAGIPLHPTQIYASVWEFLALGFLLTFEKRKPQKGVLFGLWLILHGLGRALVEQFRGDFRGGNVFNLSISTWISVLIILGGIKCIHYCSNLES